MTIFWKHDLRGLFWVDPYTHSGVYDGLSLVMDPNWVLNSASMGKDSKRGRIQPWIDSESGLQAVCAQLLVFKARKMVPTTPDDSIGHTFDESILRRIRTRKDVLMSPATLLAHFRVNVDGKRARYKLLQRRHKMLEGRNVYLNDRIPLGSLYYLADAENVGIINTPEYYPYPAGVGVRESPIRYVFELEPFLSMCLRLKV